MSQNRPIPATRLNSPRTHSFQGEEGKIVILSTVRNGGGSDDDIESRNPTIGFLKVCGLAFQFVLSRQG